MRTLIVRDGQEFELPEPHTISLYEGDATYVVLDAPDGGSLFVVSEIQERGDAIVVRLGDELGMHGYASADEVVPKVAGYPFPTPSPARRFGRIVDSI
jgi:hypothetical protein